MMLAEWEYIKLGYVRIEDDFFSLVNGSQEVQVSFHADQSLRSRTYFVNRKVSRDYKEGPASEYFSQNGNVSYRMFCKNDKCHRPWKEGPAYESFYLSGKVRMQSYYVNGKLSRNPLYGPAFINYDNAGSIWNEEYHYNGKQILNGELVKSV